MAPTEESKAAAEAVKTEANALFQGKNFREAYAKYSDAIALDDTNAVLFANRAACSLELQEHLDAACDAQKATKLDPKYVKAWARLGKSLQALRAYSRSVEAWETAVACYPKKTSGMSEAEKQMKASCEAGLRQAKSDLQEESQRRPNENVKIINKSAIERRLLPWDVAERMEANINRIGQSSAWVILNAHREFEKGCEKMFKTVETDKTLAGPLGAIADITNALLRDQRAFAATTPDWIDTYNRQLMMEVQYYGAWPNIGPAEVQRKALALQKEKGFQATRGALSITLRAWFMRAYLEENANRDSKTALQFYRSILSVLEWGLKTWKDVPNSERGAIFTETFIRGIRKHYLNAYLSACQKVGFRSVPGLDSEELDRLAEEQIKETNENMPKGDEDYLRDGGFYCSFFSYPVAEAYAIRGAIVLDKGVKLKDTDPEQANEYFEKAKKHYMMAAETLPKDEEFHLLYLKVAFEAFWHRGDPLRDCLACAQLISMDKPAVSKIWRYSSFKRNLDAHLAQVSKFRERAHIGIIEGNFFEHSPATVVNLYEC